MARSVNDIAYDIINAAERIEPLVDEWFAAKSEADNKRREFFCRFCLSPAPDEWGATLHCPKHPRRDQRGYPVYMQTCEFEIGGGSLPEGVSMPTAVIGNVPQTEDESRG